MDAAPLRVRSAFPDRPFEVEGETRAGFDTEPVTVVASGSTTTCRESPR